MYRCSKSTRVFSVFLVCILAAACVTLAGCGSAALGNRVERPLETIRSFGAGRNERDVTPRESSKPVAEARDERVLASIERLIVPNSADAWVCNAGWDEYLVRIHALSGEPVQIREIAIFDALEQRIESRAERSDLVDGTHEIERRYEQSGKLVRADGTNGWVAAGVGVAGGGIVAATGSPSVAFMAGGPAMGAVIAGTCLVLLAHAGVVRLVNNVRVNSEIQRRRTTLPVDLARGEEASIDVFFPVTPLSERAEVVYIDGQGEHRLQVDTSQARLVATRGSPPVLLQRPDPKFPDDVRRAGVSEGYVKAMLTLDSQGRVRCVNLFESVPPHVFAMEARRNFQRWVYSEGRNNCRIVEATLEFKR